MPGSWGETDVWILPDGGVHYLERAGLDLSALGLKESRRLSRIFQDEAGGSWQVCDAQTGLSLGSFLSREEAVEFEHGYYRSRMRAVMAAASAAKPRERGS